MQALRKWRKWRMKALRKWRKWRRSRKTRTANQANGKQTPAAPRPANDDTEVWKAYWKAQGQEWRTEPEIDAERQKHLDERRSITPDIKEGIYPFKGNKLSRADVEWLLATHESSGIRGPVDWNDESQRQRVGLDLRGADLHQANLHALPLTGLRGSLTRNEWVLATEEQRTMAIVQMGKADLGKAKLEGADLYGAELKEAALNRTDLRGAGLGWAKLNGADLGKAILEGADLRETELEGVLLFMTSLKGANLSGAKLERAKISEVLLSDERRIGPWLADVQWRSTNLATVDWSQVAVLRDEYQAQQKKTPGGKRKNAGQRLFEYQTAVRANRQLAVALREQGLNEEADHFAYRAQVLQRKVRRRQHRYLKYVGLCLLWLLAGHGYRPWRSVLWYLVIIMGFALAYFAFGHISPLEAFVLSLTSFHGRGFFPGTNLTLSDPRVVLAAFEAVVGLLIEISFIATFTQRFFGK